MNSEPVVLAVYGLLMISIASVIRWCGFLNRAEDRTSAKRYPSKNRAPALPAHTDAANASPLFLSAQSTRADLERRLVTQ